MLEFVERWALNRMQRRIGEWGVATFPNATADSITRHLRDEADELRANALEPPIAGVIVGEEAADVVLLVMHLCHRKGESLGEWLHRKERKNRRRVWQTEQNERGYQSHIEEGT